MKYNTRIVLAFWRSHKLPTPEVEYKFHLFRKWKFDFAWPLYGLALEVQGGLFSGGAHARGAAIRKDHEKRNAAVAAGYRILYCLPEEVCISKTAMMIEECLKWRSTWKGKTT